MPKYAREAAGGWFSAMLAFGQKSSFIWREMPYRKSGENPVQERYCDESML